MLKLFAVLVWSTLYFYGSSKFIYQKWSVPVFKFGQWKKLLSDWWTDKWIVDTPNEYTLVTVLILWIPVWLIGIYFVTKLFRNKKQTIIRQATASHPFIPAYTPSQMPSQGKSAQLEATPMPAAQMQETPSQFNGEGIQPSAPAQDDVKMAHVPKHQGEADALEKIETLAQEFGLTAFPHVLLENQLIPITISNDSDALLIKVLADPGIWQVQTTEPLESAIWTNGTINKTALKEIVLGKNILMKMEPDSVVTPVLVLAQGTLANANTIVPWFNQHGIEVVTLSDNKQLDILTLDDIIIKYFPQEENQEEENENAQASIV